MPKCKNCGGPKPPISKVAGLCDKCAIPVLQKKQKSYSASSNRSKAIDKFSEYVERRMLHEIAEHGQVQCLESKLRLERGLELHEQCPRNGLILPANSQKLKLAQMTKFKGLGFHVAHIFSKGAQPGMYYLRENSIILCR